MGKQSRDEPLDPFPRARAVSVHDQPDDPVSREQRADYQQEAAHATLERALAHETTSRETHFVCITPGRFGPTNLNGNP